MTRLEFVSMSLIKGLKGVISIDGEQEIVTLKSIDTDGNEIWVSSDNWVYSSLNYDIKIICRTLSDLTKEIEHGGKMVILSEIFGLAPNEINLQHLISKIENEYISIKEFMILIEYHFDVCGLIEKGEAIDVNTLTENPYK